MERLLIFFMALAVLGCEENKEEAKNQDVLLIGKWKSVEVWADDGNGVQQSPVPEENAIIYEFTATTVSRNNLEEGCNVGTYTLEGNMINFEFPCGLSYQEEIQKLSEKELVLDTKNFETLVYKYERLD